MLSPYLRAIAVGDARGAAFRDAFMTLRRRVDLLIALPIDKLDRLARERDVRAIAGER